jgi:hypothetical protein
MTHITIVERTPYGFLGRCETCGDRAPAYTGHGEAESWCDRHEWLAQHIRLNVGSRPSLKTLERVYRENATNLVYTDTERRLWREMADELAEEIAARTPGPLPGQMGLWEAT